MEEQSRVRAAIILKDYPEGIISRKHIRDHSARRDSGSIYPQDC